MIARDIGGQTWYVVARHYPTALMARRAFDRLEAKLDLSMGDEGIGLYRMSPRTNGGNLDSGITVDDAHPVVAVTLDLATARKADRLSRDGAEWEPLPDFCNALIARRARVVMAHAGETGRLLIRRPDEGGARLYQDGSMRERDPGRG